MRASVSSNEIASAKDFLFRQVFEILRQGTSSPYERRTRISFLWRFRTGRSYRSGRGEADGCSGCKGVRRIDDYLVRFRDAVQDFGVDAEVPADFDVAELHNTVGVHDANFHILPVKYECV